MNGAAFAAASAFDRRGSAGYQTPAHRVSQTVAKKKQGPASGAAAKPGEASKATVDQYI